MYYVNKMFGFSFPKIPQISAEEFKAAVDKKENFILIDVRTKDEYQRGKIKGSINIPLDKVKNNILEKVPNKSARIYVYCFSGSRSVYAVEMMTKLGYTNVFDIKSGLLGWRTKGFPIQQ